MITITHVKLCTVPDEVCLQGGCGYCSQKGAVWWKISTLRNYAERKGWLSSFLYGYERHWPNRSKRTKDLDTGA